MKICEQKRTKDTVAIVYETESGERVFVAKAYEFDDCSGVCYITSQKLKNKRKERKK